MPRRGAGCLAITLAGATSCLTACGSLSSAPAQPRAVVSATTRCPTPAAASRATRAVNAAKARYLTESQGVTIHADLRQIARDNVLLEALRAGNLKVARAEANRQLVRHVVRIRVRRGSRLLVDANSTSFDVAGSGMELRDSRGAILGRLEITVQDVIGFIKLMHRVNNAETVVRGARGQVRTLFPAAARLSLPRSGCTQIGGRTYVVRSLRETSFSGEPLTIWLLTAA